MKTKKIIAAAMALSMVSALAPMGVFAEDGTQINQNSTDKTGKTNVTYKVESTYTVTIPPTVALGEDATFSVSDVNLATGKKIVVKLTDTANKDKQTTTDFTVATADTTQAFASYQVKKGNDVLSIGDTAYEFAYDGTTKTGSGSVSFTEPTDAKFAGTYTDQLTFTISVE